MTAGYQELAQTHVLVTGAAAGIGRAVALAFHRQGARVTALDRDEGGLAETVARAAGNAPLVACRCDVTDAGEVERVFGRAVAERGPLRVLVNNAGVDDRRGFELITQEQWRFALAVNLDHQFLLSQLAAPGMREAGGGAIVNMSSTAWMKLAANLASYHAAKAGIVGLTRGLARELGPDLIRVNAVAPGRVVTERVERDTLTEAWIAETHSIQCLPRLITPADIADTVLFLASDSARAITGQTIIVDGGVV
jgi:NAD(P)-dependent dehydrogenase (short-subunit alcohol dehydrogenase family)